MKRYLSLDFETTTDPNDCRVWVWGSYDIYTEQFVYGTSLDELIRYLAEEDTTAYFHNLAFDGEFLITYLFRAGFTFTPEKSVRPQEFTTLIGEMGQFYSLKAGFTNSTLIVYDSLKIIPLKVSKIPKAFGLEEAKGDIDYKAYREEGYVPTQEEIDYLKHDVIIVGKALRIMFDSGLKKMTQASNAMCDYKERIGKKSFRYYFPVCNDSDAFIRSAYRGGFTYLAPRFRNKDIGQGLVFDVNSLYPWAMRHCLLPFGRPIPYDGQYEEDVEYPLYVQEFMCKFDLKKDHIPTIQLKHSSRFKETEYITTSDGEDIVLTLTSVDLALFLEHYDVEDLVYISGYKLRASYGLFDDYIDHWFAQKEEATLTGNAGQRQISKLMQNSLYGKFGTNPLKRKKQPYYNEELNAVKYRTSEAEYDKPVYVAMAAFITAYARDKTIRSAQSCYDRFIYADTDSLHITGLDIPKDLEVHPTKLGAWDNELVFSKARYLKSKCYIELGHSPSDTNGEDKLKVTIAGLPDTSKDKVNFDNFHYGFTCEDKLRTTRVAGGIVLTETPFTIKEPL